MFSREKKGPATNVWLAFWKAHVFYQLYSRFLFLYFVIQLTIFPFIYVHNSAIYGATSLCANISFVFLIIHIKLLMFSRMLRPSCSGVYIIYSNNLSVLG